MECGNGREGFAGGGRNTKWSRATPSATRKEVGLVMKKVLSIIAVIVLAGITAKAAQDGAGYSAKVSLLAKQSPAVKVEASVLSARPMCGKCSVPVKVDEQVSTKPGRGQTEATVFVD